MEILIIALIVLFLLSPLLGGKKQGKSRRGGHGSGFIAGSGLQPGPDFIHRGSPDAGAHSPETFHHGAPVQHEAEQRDPVSAHDYGWSGCDSSHSDSGSSSSGGDSGGGGCGSGE